MTSAALQHNQTVLRDVMRLGSHSADSTLSLPLCVGCLFMSAATKHVQEGCLRINQSRSAWFSKPFHLAPQRNVCSVSTSALLLLSNVRLNYASWAPDCTRWSSFPSLGAGR